VRDGELRFAVATDDYDAAVRRYRDVFSGSGSSRAEQLRDNTGLFPS
jgi:hypothetical protein